MLAPAPDGTTRSRGNRDAGAGEGTDIVAMTETLPARDYSLTGPSSRHAVEAGLVAAEWYHTDVPRKTLRI